MMVSPSATRAASTNDAEARKSEASTAAALSGVFPFTIARWPSILMFAHAHQFLRVHEPVLKNIFRHHRSPIRLGYQRHVLRLHVGGKAGIFLSINIRRLQSPVADHPHRVARRRGSHANFRKLLQYDSQMRRVAADHIEISAGQGS